MDVFKTLILDTPTVEGATGTVTSVDLTAGTGISVSGGPITSSGSITVTNTAPDQTVSIASGTGISVTGSYPSFTVTNSSPSLGGDVVGPASATDNAVVRFDSTTGKLIQDSGVSISDANLLTTTALTVNDNTILGSSNTDTVNFNARVSSEFTPATDNTYDLGRTGHEWRDLYINGTANIDSLVADTADVNGGTIDGATIGASTASSGAFTTLSASDDANFDSGTLFVDASADSVGIGTTSPSAKLDVLAGDSASANGQAIISGGRSLGSNVVGGAGGLLFTNSYWTGGYGAAGIYGIDSGASGGDMVFSTTANGGGTTGTPAERMRIDQAGNVGVGTTSPSAKLDVNGNAAVTGEVTSTASLRTTGAEAANLTASASLGYIAGDGKGRLLVQGPDASTDGSLRIRLTRSDASNSIAVADFTTTGLAVTGNVSVGIPTPTWSVAGFSTIEAQGSTSAGLIGVSTATADADNAQLGQFYFADRNTTSGLAAVARIVGYQSGTTANNRGSRLVFSTKADGGALTDRLAILANGNVGVGTTSPAQKLHVVGEIIATGNITAYYSDDRLKTKLGNIENALDKVSKLNGFYYEANETAQALGYKPVREVGLSAQQVEEVLPEVVAPAPIDNEYKTLHYERVIPLLVEAIKELKAEIELLKK